MVNEKLLLITDSPLGDTGYSSVGKELMKMLKGKYELYYGGLQYIGKPIQIDDYKLLSVASLSNSADSLDMIGKVDHIIYLRNSWASGMSSDPLRLLRAYSDDIIMYSPVEERYLPKRFFNGLKGFDKINNWYDRIITTTKSGVDSILEHGIESDYLYHNLIEDKLCRKHYDNIEHNVLNISYSVDYRKNIGMYILLTKNFNDFNFNWLGLSQYYVIPDYLEIYGVKNFHIINQHKHYSSFKFLSNEQISQVYGQHNFYIQMSFKEGFDLTTLEALSNGLITFMPNDQLHKELFYDYPNAIFVSGSYDYPAMNQLEYFIPIENWIDSFAENKDRKKMGINVKDRFKFESVREKLLKILSKGV